MKQIWIPIITALLIGCSEVVQQDEPELPQTLVDSLAVQLKTFAQAMTEDQFPRSYQESSGYRMKGYEDWTSGFPSGSFWYMYELTGDQFWKSEAESALLMLEPVPTITSTHDLGFMAYCSFGNGYRLTGNESYRETVIAASKTLASRYNPTVKAIRSWDWGDWANTFPVIIDNMMNLEMLFAATKLTGDSTYYSIAIDHAKTTLANHFRPNNSSYHVVTYDTLTGGVLTKVTQQGLHDESSWGRGQAWGLYGFTLCYRESGDTAFLEQAEKITTYILDNLPENFVSYWDYDDPAVPSVDVQRDASSAAITASALYELSSLAGNTSYRDIADSIVNSLIADYLAVNGSNGGFLLKSSVGAMVWDEEVNAAINYADYYFLEALIRRNDRN